MTRFVGVKSDPVSSKRPSIKGKESIQVLRERGSSRRRKATEFRGRSQIKREKGMEKGLTEPLLKQIKLEMVQFDAI